MGIGKNKAHMLGIIGLGMAFGVGFDDYNDPYHGEPARRNPKQRPFGQAIPKGLKVFEIRIESKEDVKYKFIVAALNQKNADNKFDKLFIDLNKLGEEKGDNILEDDINKLKRKHFKYADYEHVL